MKGDLLYRKMNGAQIWHKGDDCDGGAVPGENEGSHS